MAKKRRSKTTPTERRSQPRSGQWPAFADAATIVVSLASVAGLSLFPIRNNDIWWHLAVGAETVKHGFITTDPFMFSVPGLPWVPHAWLAGLVFYFAHGAFGPAGLVLLRAVLVLLTFTVLVAVLRRLRLSLTLASPLLLVVALNAHSRFIIRPHLFEYLFVALILAYLLQCHRLRGWRFFVPPIVLQVLWVNLHASFYLGIAMTVLFFVGEALSARLRKREQATVDHRRALALVGLLVAASFVNPRPLEFVLQPLGAEQRELLTQFTLEWKSPFDPALAIAAFHPYYELILATALVAFLAAGKRVRLSSLLIVGLFVGLSLQAHRFRVELGLVALPLLLAQLREAPVVDRMRKGLGRSPGAYMAPYVIALIASTALMVTARDRLQIDLGVSDRFPDRAFDFVREENVAMRSFHTVGFGSYLIWHLYPERQSFIDGRNIDAGLARDFFACQTNSTGFNATIRKYDLDAFIIPVPERSDGGMQNLHNFLIDAKGWSLVHMDRVAYVYAKDRTVPAAWLADHAYRHYHPLRFQDMRFTAAQLDSVAAEIERASEEGDDYLRPWLDLGRFYGGVGDVARARAAMERVLAIDSGNAEAAAILRRLDG